MKKHTYLHEALLEGLPPPPQPWRGPAVVLALVTAGRFETLEAFLSTVLDRGEPAELLEETLLQAHLFAGFPRAVRALKTFRRVLERGGTGEPHRPSRRVRAEASLPPRVRRARGRRVFDAVYGPNGRAVLHALEALHPGYGRWILEDAYGRVLSRPRLPLLWRELCAVAALAVSDVPEQLYSHVRGALRLGAGRGQVEEAIRSVAPLASPKKIDDALEIVSKMDVN